MACLCRSWLSFYMHTFHPHLIAGVDQAHLLIVVNNNQDHIRALRREVQRLDTNPNVHYINQREFLNDEGNNVYEVLVVLRLPN